MEQSDKYNCIIVEDEPIARKIIRSYMEQIPILKNAGEFKNAIEALEFVNKSENIEIIFLDINMPQLNGMAMAKILKKEICVIFTTAYSNYAIESYEINAVDYLLKPFSFERFTKAVFKAIEICKIRNTKLNSIQKVNMIEEEIMFIKSEGKNYPVQLMDIVYCEAKKNYTQIILQNGLILMPLISFTKLEEELNSTQELFIRVHRSFFISKKYITAVASNYVFVGSYKIPIGDLYKKTKKTLLLDTKFPQNNS